MNQALIQALMSVPMFSGQAPNLMQQLTPLSPLQLPGMGGQSQGQGAGGMLSGLMKMLPMGGQSGTPPNPYAGGGGGYMDAGSMPMTSMG